MRRWSLDVLRCPESGDSLKLEAFDGDGSPDDEITSGTLVTLDGKHRYEIVNGVPRFVELENYAVNFGFQWNHFRQSQLDSYSGIPISRDRFFRYSGWRPEELAGRLVLDVGCGAGRFTEVALNCGARVIALDYSTAVDACQANHGHKPGLTVVQGNVYKLPLATDSFDFIYCFGVLQHTPDVEAAFRSLPPVLAPGGRLAIDVYPRLWRNLLWPKFWLRPLTKRIPAAALFRWVEKSTPSLLKVSTALSKVPFVGRQLRYFVPVANHGPDYPLSPSQLQEWAVLDTFDMLAPAHDQPQSLETVQRWLEDAGLEDVWVSRMGFNVGRGRRPSQWTARTRGRAS